MALASNPTVPRDGTFTISDGTSGTPLSFEVEYEDGDAQFSDLADGQMQIQAFKDRGVTYALRKTEDQEIAFSFSAHLVGLVDATGGSPDATLLDVVKRLNAWSAAKSTSEAYGDVYTVKIVWAIRNRGNTAGRTDTLTLPYCHITAALAEGTPSKISISGVAYPLGGSAVTIANAATA